MAAKLTTPAGDLVWSPFFSVASGCFDFPVITKTLKRSHCLGSPNSQRSLKCLPLVKVDLFDQFKRFAAQIGFRSLKQRLKGEKQEISKIFVLFW